jgi:hypothetical protein
MNTINDKNCSNRANNTRKLRSPDKKEYVKYYSAILLLRKRPFYRISF